jgi:hypothetical protein
VAARLAADIGRIVEALGPWSRGRSYLNFAQFPSDETWTMFGEDAYRRLQQVKARYDASGTARADHEIRMGA